MKENDIYILAFYFYRKLYNILLERHHIDKELKKDTYEWLT